METVLLIVHLLIAICLIAVVLLQRSEGGALGIGGGGGGGMVSSRGAATALSKLTWGLAIAFITTSITLAILAGGDPAGRSVLDEVDLGDPDGIVLPDLPPAPEESDGGGLSLPLPDLGAPAGGGPEGGGTAGGGTEGGASPPAAPPTAD